MWVHRDHADTINRFYVTLLGSKFRIYSKVTGYLCLYSRGMTYYSKEIYRTITEPNFALTDYWELVKEVRLYYFVFYIPLTSHLLITKGTLFWKVSLLFVAGEPLARRTTIAFPAGISHLAAE